MEIGRVFGIVENNEVIELRAGRVQKVAATVNWEALPRRPSRWIFLGWAKSRSAN